MEVNLPLAPVSALELLIKNDSKLRRMFSTTAVAGTQCEVCGWALPMEEAYPSYSETLQEEPAVITLQPGKRAPIHLTQTVLMQQYRSTWISEEHVCTGEQLARHHPKWAMTATKSRKFDDAVALEFGHWDKQAMGGGGGPICDPPTASKRHGGIWTGGTSGHQHPQPCRRLHTKRST
ncbi:putative SLACS retrotransposable element [Trypanosoma cruzi]|uniref:Putative SLACS retrotransposable element n=1 Tax=Trypanosoma cruzi TaxID=5693 RepID=A0A2V2UTA9_TRYCR|nr:putative SLACS retrotransposable element [Trypanosoma cruzi]